MITDYHPSGTHVAVVEFVPSNPRRSTWLYVVLALLIALLFVSSAASAADWMMVVQEPGKSREVVYIFYDYPEVACITDSRAQDYIKGTKVSCERIPALRLATQPPVISKGQ